MKFKLNLIIFLFSSAFFSSACSLESPTKTNRFTITLEDHPELDSVASPSETTEYKIQADPTSLANFDCFAINITGPGIGPNAEGLKGCTSANNFEGKGVGILTRLFKKGSSVEVDLPTGKSRSFTVYGVYPPGSECLNGANSSSEKGYGYFLGGVTRDIAEATSISIPISFNTSSIANRVSCPDNDSNNLASDKWVAMSGTGAPSNRTNAASTFINNQVFVWGGYDGTTYFNNGGLYNPSTNSWTSITTTNAPTARMLAKALTMGVGGTHVFVFGGRDATLQPSGGVYNPATDTWTVTTTTNAPPGRQNFSMNAISDNEALIFGGDNLGSPINSGGVFNTSTNTWTTTTTTLAPTARTRHAAVWAASELIIWGGDNGAGTFYNTGSRFNPGTNTWTNIATVAAPTARSAHSAAWTGTEMIVWGGENAGTPVNNGGRYSFAGDSWSALAGSPLTARSGHSVTYTGSKMTLWGGLGTGTVNFNDGAVYTYSTQTWQMLTSAGAGPSSLPQARHQQATAGDGNRIFIFGGIYAPTSTYLNTGGFIQIP